MSSQTITQQLQHYFSYLKGDRYVWMIAIGLSLFGVLVVYSATGSLAYRTAGGDTELYLRRHVITVLLSLIVTYVFHRIDIRYYSRVSRMALLASAPLLLFAWQFGTSINDANRWLTVPLINYSFQPSDLARLALIVNLAAMLSKRQNNIQDFQRAIVPMLLWCGVICGFIGLANFSTAALLFANCMVLLFIGRVHISYLGMLVVIGLFAGLFAFSFGQRGSTVAGRIDRFLDEEELPFQVEQAYIAIAKGGLTGEGMGKSTQRNFLPNSFSDYVFAIIIEEYGLLGALFVMALYIALLYRSVAIVSQTTNRFEGLLVAGLTFSIVFQAFVHMGVVVGILPVTGLVLPMISMGGTSLLFTGMAFGMILSVSRRESTVMADSDYTGRRNTIRRDTTRINTLHLDE